MITRYIDVVNEILEQVSPVEALYGESLDPDLFSRNGLFVKRRFIPEAAAQQLCGDWRRQNQQGDGGRLRRYNPVESLELPESLTEFSRSSAIVELLTPLFGPSLGIFKRRVVAKDSAFSGNIFLHQDSPYQIGSLNKASLFVALTNVSPNSGGLRFWLGTHRFGYLGDAGEINPRVMNRDWPSVLPTLQAGDAILMDSRLWHESDSNTSGQDRIMTDFIYQRGEDPSSLERLESVGWVVCDSPFRHDAEGIFVRSRVSRIRELSDQLSAVSPTS